jgi:hypothetical protein
MTTTCPHCSTTFRIDPAKVPEDGVSVRCSVCEGVFHVSTGGTRQPEREAETSPPSPAAPETPASPSAPSAAFGAPDPDAKARRLARALISDIATYHPERRERSLQAGKLRTEFQEEIKKSWEEYMSQVGADTARNAPHFRDALNDILAQGQRVF